MPKLCRVATMMSFTVRLKQIDSLSDLALSLKRVPRRNSATVALFCDSVDRA